MFLIDRRTITHFDFLLIFLIIPIIVISNILVFEINETLGNKQLLYYAIGFLCFFIAFIIPIRKLFWIIPFFYWVGIGLLISVEFFGVAKLGAKRWIEIPLLNTTIQPSELIKPAYILMLAYLIHQNPPPQEGYNLPRFLKLSFYIMLPSILILKQPDLGSALIFLIVGYGVLFIIGVNWKIWVSLALIIGLIAPFLYNNLHDYQKKRITDFLSDKPSYHVQQSIIAIGSGGLYGKEKDEATQAQLKFLPIATSDFIFAYLVERFGFWGAFAIISIYAFLILHILSLTIVLKGDYFSSVVAVAIAFMIFIFMAVNISMTIGLAPVVGIPLPLFSYGGSSFVNFMILFGILENLIARRFNYMYEE